MKVRHAAISLLLVTGLYLLALVWLDSKRNVFALLPLLADSLPVLFASSAACCLIRFVRWHWLLRRVGHKVPLGRGLLAYVAGFAFTATPGKVGELVRIRYLQPMGVPPQRVIAAFVYERALDVLVVLALASLAATPLGLLPFAAAFVALVVLAVVLLARNPHWATRVAAIPQRWGWHGLARLMETLGEGFAGVRVWTNPAALTVSLLLGAVAWSVQSLAFVWFLGQLGALVPWTTAMAVFPLAQLVGAASMLPGGIGSTEAAVVSLLVASGVLANTAALAAVGMRIATLWGAIAWGLAALLWLENTENWLEPRG